MNKKIKTKFGLFGMSYDTSASKGYPGARYAPAQIRSSMDWIFKRIEDNMLYDVDSDKLVDMSKIALKDYGDATGISRYNNQQSLEEIKECINGIYAEGYSPILLGGDHSTGWPGIKALHENTEGNIGIIHVDAHLDLVKESSVQGPYSGSSQMRRASELDRISASNFVQIGQRGYNSPEHYHFIRESGITLVSADRVFEMGVDAVAALALEKAGKNTDHIYLSVDIDVLDSAFAPGSGANEPGGLTSAQLFRLVKQLAPYIDAIDIVEVNPMTDYNNMTSIVAARLIFDYMIANYHANT